MGSKPADGAVSAGMIGLGVFAVLGGLVLLCHENRDRLRWRLRAIGSRPSMIAAAIVLPLAAACAGWAGPGKGDDDVAPATRTVGSALGTAALLKELEGERDTLKQQLEEKQQANDAARQRLDDRLRDVRHARAAYSLKPEEAQKKIVDQAEQFEEKVQRAYRDLRAATRMTARAISEAERIEKKLERDQSDLEAFVVGSRGTASKLGLLRIGTSLLFVLAAVVPFSLVRRRRRRERLEQSRKCPRCLNKDTLDFVAPSSDHEFDEGQTMFRLKVCNACDYEIRENYIHENRLCFPTVGIRSSGKTHWLLMLYDQIKNSNIPVASAIRKIPSREDKQFDEMVQRLLYAGGGLAPTVYGLPNPLTFHVHDADRSGANKSMVNLFDYSGEMRNFDIDTNEFRRRASCARASRSFSTRPRPPRAQPGSSPRRSTACRNLPKRCTRSGVCPRTHPSICQSQSAFPRSTS